MKIEIGDVVELQDDLKMVGVVIYITHNGLCDVQHDKANITYAYRQDQLRLYCETHSFKVGEYVMTWPDKKVGKVLSLTQNGCTLDIGGKRTYVSIKHISHGETVEPKIKTVTYTNTPVFDKANEAVRAIFNETNRGDTSRRCKYCKGTGKILLLDSYVECECVAGD